MGFLSDLLDDAKIALEVELASHGFFDHNEDEEDDEDDEPELKVNTLPNGLPIGLSIDPSDLGKKEEVLEGYYEELYGAASACLEYFSESIFRTFISLLNTVQPTPEMISEKMGAAGVDLISQVFQLAHENGLVIEKIALEESEKKK